VIVDGNPGIIKGVTPTGDLRVCLNSTAAAVAGVPVPADDPNVATASSIEAAPEELTEICLKPGTISLGYRR